MKRVSEIPRTVGSIGIVFVVAFAQRAGLGAGKSVSWRWIRSAGTYLHVSPGVLSFQTLGGDAPSLHRRSERSREKSRARRVSQTRERLGRTRFGPFARRVRGARRWRVGCGDDDRPMRAEIRSVRLVVPARWGSDAAIRRIANSRESAKNAGAKFL